MKNSKWKQVLLVWSLVIAMLIGSITPGVASAEEKVVQKTTVNVKESDLEVSGTNSFGKLIAELLDGEINGSNNYYISDLEIEEKQAKVSYSVSENCSLVVAVYDEQGIQMLGSGMKSITVENTEVTVDIGIEELPQYFLVKAFLLDSEKNTALSQVYICDHYTQGFQEFLNKTTDDFEQEKILNLDDDMTTNFAVFNDETTHVKGEGESNRMVSVDLENNKYVIADADNKTKALQVGEIFYYTDGDYDIMVRIKTIDVNGDTVTITAEEAKLDEIFSYIKIEADTGEAEIEMDNSNLEEGVTYLGFQEEEPDFSNNARSKRFGSNRQLAANGHYSKDWHMYELNPKVVQSAGNVSASISGKIRLGVSYRGDIDVYLDSNRFEIDFTIKPAITLNLSVKGSIELDVPLGKGVAISPMPGVYITFDPRFKASLSAEMSANIKGEFALGMRYDTNQGLVNKSQEPTLTADYDMNASVYIGLSLEPKAKIISDYLASAWLKIDAGAKIKVSASDSTKKDNKKQHDCTNCLEGSIHFLGSLSAGADVNLLFKEFHPSVVLWKPDFKVADFYYSATYNEGGLTTCPHIRYLTTVNVVDKLGRDFSGIKVYWDNGEQSITDKSGDAKTYLANGPHTALVKNPNNANDTKTREFEVKDKSSTVQLKADWSRGNFVNIKVVDIHENAAQNVTVYCSAYTDGNVTDEDGMAYFTAQNGTYDFYIVDADGNRITKSATLNGADENLTLQTTWNCSHLVTMNIQDKNGVAVAGAKVTYGDKKVTADENGKVEIWAANGKHTFYIRDAEENMVLPTVKEVTVKDADVSETVILGDDIEGMFDESEHGNIIDSGKCGATNKDDIKWKLYDDGLLCIYGQGSMKNYYIRYGLSDSKTEVPTQWKEHCERINKIIISDTVNNIGSYAFYGCSNLNSIALPNSITNIGGYAFYGCSGLNSITLPNSITNIGSMTFYKCSGLNSIMLPNSITNIGTSAFSECNSLSSIMLPDSITNIKDRTFYGCSSLSSIMLPNSVTNIGPSAFSGCNSLSSIVLPDGVTSIERGTFKNCSALKSIIIPDGVISILGYGSLNQNAQEGAFSGCSSLKNVTIPNSVTNIGAFTFSGCNSLSSITIPDRITTINEGTFYGCSSLKSIILPRNLECINNNAFRACSSLKSIRIPDSVISIGNDNGFFSGGTFAYCSSLKNITIPDGVTTIGSSTFEGCSSLKSIIIPDSVTTIGSSTFEGCSSLKSMTIPNSVTTIGTRAFFKCSNLCDIVIPNSVIEIGDHAFTDCTSLNSIILSDRLTCINKCTFRNCSKLKEIRIPNGVTGIGFGAFCDCTSLSTIEIPDGVISIGGDEFCPSYYHDNYYHDSSSGYIGVFSYCDNLRNVTIPNSVTVLGASAFRHCKNLENIVLSNNISNIEEFMFQNCYNLTSVTIPEGVRSIGDFVFDGCNLASITIPSSVTSIGSYNFPYVSKSMTIYAPSDSYAETFAMEHKFNFIATDLSKKMLIKKQMLKKVSSNNLKSVYRQNVIEGQDYILLVCRKSGIETSLSKDNLLYIDQATANGNGIVNYNYLPREEVDNAKVMILGPENYDLSALEKILMACENGLYTKESQEFAKEDLRTALRLALKWTFAESQKEIDILARRLNDFLDEVEEESISSPTPDVGDSDATSSPSQGNTASPNPTNVPSQSTKPDDTVIPTATPSASPDATFSPKPIEIPVLIPTLSPSTIPTKKPDVQVTAIPESSIVPTDMPTEVPTDVPMPSVNPSSSPDIGNSNNTNPAKKLKKGSKVVESKTKVVYKITGVGTNKTVEYKKSTKKNAVSITIPVKIKLQGKTYKVTSIGNGAFKNSRKLKTVKIGKNVKTIGKSAFSGCSKLTNVTIGKNVRTIGAKAFYRCKNLRYILVKTKKLTLSSIGKKAFSGGYHLPRIKTDKSIWKRYSSIFIQRGMSGRALFVVDPVKLVI